MYKYHTSLLLWCKVTAISSTIVVISEITLVESYTVHLPTIKSTIFWAFQTAYCMFFGVWGYVCQLIFLYDLSQELSNLCHCVQHPWKLTTSDFWSSRNIRKPLSKLKHVLRKCSGVSQKKIVYCKVDVFVKTIYCKVMTIENEHFPIYLLGNPINVCWNPQNRASFSKTIDLRGHLPRFTLKMNVFPSISLETP